MAPHLADPAESEPSADLLLGPIEPRLPLVSLVIVCCGNRPYTEQCLESVLRHTTSPYELLLVDNASPDDTRGYLERLVQRPGPERVVILANESNCDFPAACNQALAKARGRFVGFLHNDVVVTAGWLHGLLHCAGHDWPRVGMVGPMTNHGVRAQSVPFTFTTEDALDAFAERRRLAFSGRAKVVKRLSSCCLLVRCDLLDVLGPFDERFSPGFFEDEDLCLRFRNAGHQLLAAASVYVHHHGGVTFNSLETELEPLFERNREQFREKWGPEHGDGFNAQWYAGPSLESVPGQTLPEEPAPTGVSSWNPSTPATARRAHVSLCLLVENEDADLAACLHSMHDLVDEIHMLNTGSSHQIRAVAFQFGAMVQDIAWVDSYAVARNEGLRRARGEWILWMDAGDRVDASNRIKLQKLLRSPEDDAAYTMTRWSPPDPRTGTITRLDQLRLLRNHPAIRWEYRVHEQVLGTVRRLGDRICNGHINIQHAGPTDALRRRQQAERNLRLLRLDHAERPDDAYVLFHLGATHLELGLPAEALPYLENSRRRLTRKTPFASKLFALLVHVHRLQQQDDQARTVCQDGRRRFPKADELLFLEGVLQADHGNAASAEATFRELLQPIAPRLYFTPIDAGLRSYLAHHHLALLLAGQGRAADAETHWREVIAENPDFGSAWLGLAKVLVTRNRTAELTALLDSLDRREPESLPALLVRAESHFSRREAPAAHRLLAAACDRWPQALPPRLLLSKLLADGGDWHGARQVLEEVLSLDPSQLEAHRQLRALKE